MTDHPIEKPFRVTIVIRVDRPELRGSTYAWVDPGIRTLHVQYHETQGEAVRAFEAVLGGSWDFASEYAMAVQVDRLRSWCGPRAVRRRVDRARDQTESRSERTRRLLQVAAVRRMRARGASQPDWMFPLAWRHPPLATSQTSEVSS